MTLSIAMAEDNGYQNIEDCIREGVTLKAGDKVYAQYMKKTLALFHIGTKPLTEGMNILGAHVDSPRLDVKQNPLYEDTQMGSCLIWAYHHISLIRQNGDSPIGKMHLWI